MRPVSASGGARGLPVPGEPCGAYDFNANGSIDLGDFAGDARTIAE